jgi:hypothetical protein
MIKAAVALLVQVFFISSTWMMLFPSMLPFVVVSI